MRYTLRTFAERAFSAALHRSTRHGLPLPSFLEQPAWKEFQRDVTKIWPRIEEKVPDSISWRAAYRETVAHAGIILCQHMQTASEVFSR